MYWGVLTQQTPMWQGLTAKTLHHWQARELTIRMAVQSEGRGLWTRSKRFPDLTWGHSQWGPEDSMDAVHLKCLNNYEGMLSIVFNKCVFNNKCNNKCIQLLWNDGNMCICWLHFSFMDHFVNTEPTWECRQRPRGQRWVGGALGQRLTLSTPWLLHLYVALSHVRFCDPMGCNPSGSSVHGDSPGKNTGVGCHALLQRIFPTQGSNPDLPHCRRILYHPGHQGSPRILEWVDYPFSSGSSWPRNQTGVSCIAGGFFTSWATREALLICIEDNEIHPKAVLRMRPNVYKASSQRGCPGRTMIIKTFILIQFESFC